MICLKFSDMRELQKKYRQLSVISDDWFPRIKKIFISSSDQKYDVIFTTNDDMVYGYGSNIFAILGGGTPVKITKPTVIEELCGTGIRKVLFGDWFMVALTESNELYTGGLCLYGRCGNGIDSKAYYKPQKIFTEKQLIVDICCGLHYTVILTDKQTVYEFGSLRVKDPGSFSRLDTEHNSVLTPTLISFDSEEITSISCGDYHVLALTQTGKVYAWGSNVFPSLDCRRKHFESKPRLIEVPNNDWVKQISCGKDFSLLLTTEANIYSFGNNDHGQFGHNGITGVATPTLLPSLSIFTEILAFDCQSFAKNESNIIEFWGQNIVGEDVLTPQKSTLGSLQEAIINYTKYPFTIEPIILKKDSQKSSVVSSVEAIIQTTENPVTIQPILSNNDQNVNALQNSKGMPSNRVMRTMAEIFNNPKFNDFIFKIKREEFEDLETDCPTDDPNNGYDIIYCHKWIVEQNCDYLKKIFANIKSIKESNEMEIKGYSYETYFHFIQYLYTDSIETKDMKLLNELLLLSDMYSEEGLKNRCVSVIKPLIDVDNVCNFYCSAITNKSPELEEYCFEFMIQNLKTIVKSKYYLQMDPKIAKSFLSKYAENYSKN